MPFLFRSRSLVFALLMTWATAGFAQSSGSTLDRVNQWKETITDTVFRTTVVPRWIEGESAFWYRVETGPGQYEFVHVDVANAERTLAFDHVRLAEELAAESNETVEATALPFRWIEIRNQGAVVLFDAFGLTWRWSDGDGLSRSDEALSAGNRLSGSSQVQPTRRNGEATTVRFINEMDSPVQLYWSDWQGEHQPYGEIGSGEQAVQHTYAGHVWVVKNSDDQVLHVFIGVEDPSDAIIDGEPLDETAPEPSRPRSLSPDGQWTYHVVNHNAWIEHTESGEQHKLSSDGEEGNAYDGDVLWSPDSKKLVVFQVREGQERIIHLIESSPDDQLQPKLHSLNYLKPGDKIDRRMPRLFDVASKEAIPLDESLYDNPYALSDFHWWPESDAFCFYYNQRGHQVVRVIEVNATTGAVRKLIDEESETFVDYARKKYLRYVDASREILWMSERSGWNHLYRIDATGGSVKNAITSGEWVVRGVERVDFDAQELWFTAGGIVPGQDPYYLHLARVNFDGSELTVLTYDPYEATPANGTHKWRFSPDGDYLVDTWSRVDQPPVTVLRNAETGVLVCELERADASALFDTGWRTPQPFVAKGRDGSTDIYGVIFRPSDFHPGKRYPVIEEIYAGPHGAFVPKEFHAYPRQTALAELGFIVVQIDGMGTSHRSKAFHDVCWKNLGDSGFPDRIAWMRAAAEEACPQMDLDRVGIYGGSAGGQSALRALLAHGEFYKSAVADCGCHDNRMDKIWWNELWMSWPIGPHYEEQSNVTQAHHLRGDLLLIVGEMDRNVDPASTMQVVDALIKADKDFDMLVMPGVGHGAMGTDYGTRRMLDFFVEHLLE